MNLEADQAVQEARFAGACQDQHAGRPAPNLGWPGERKSIVQQAEQVCFSKRNQSRLLAWGPGFAGAWGPGLGARASRALAPAETAAAEVGAWREAGTGYPPYPPQSF